MEGNESSDFSAAYLKPLAVAPEEQPPGGLTQGQLRSWCLRMPPSFLRHFLRCAMARRRTRQLVLTLPLIWALEPQMAHPPFGRRRARALLSGLLSQLGKNKTRGW